MTSTSTYTYGIDYNPVMGVVTRARGRKKVVQCFLSVDPLTSSYPMLTPYQFASNTPIQAIDLDGLEAAVVTRRLQNLFDSFIWKNKFGPQKTGSNSYGVTPEAQRNAGKALAVGKSAGLVVVSVASVVYATPSGGASLTATDAALVGLGIVSGTYVAATETSKAVSVLTDNTGLIDEIPGNYLNATVGAVVEEMVDDELVVKRVQLALTIADGASSFENEITGKLGSPLEAIGDFESVVSITIETIEHMEYENEQSSNGCEPECGTDGN